MLRIYFLQQWFNLSDPQAEDAIYGIAPMRYFAGIDLGREAAPDETHICKFRHLIEEHGLGKKMLASVNAHLEAKGVTIDTGTIVDATTILPCVRRIRHPCQRASTSRSRWPREHDGLYATVLDCTAARVAPSASQAAHSAPNS